MTTSIKPIFLHETPPIDLATKCTATTLTITAITTTVRFLTASTLKTILGSYRNICEYLHLKPNVLPLFYPKLKAHINSWKAKPLWKKFDTRANQKCYARGKACPHTRVLIIGAGPCGLRTAIEAQLLGAKVVVVEKRDRMSRNNVLHLWPFVIDDLRALGAKKFFGKFCAGSIDHISIRQLQCILLKVALLLGVEVHTEVSFERVIEPNLNEKTGWRAEFKPSDHPVSQFEFDVIIGADGKRNTLQGFKRKEFRGKLAIAITANFINKRTEAEARVEEISGVAFIFNQKFFKDLYAETGIDLENIVYYKDDTHYFVMTAKKQSLIDKGVIREDLSDTAKLLAPDNVDRDELMNYAREAAEFSTNYQMPDLEFAVNHYGHPDVAMFDFTSMYAAENASRVIERHNYKLMSILVGDSLLEPFWPTGSGCARGFLSSMDAAWAIRSWGSDAVTPLEVLAERESIYRLLAQTTPENLNKDYKSYTIEPSTRYPNLNKNALLPHQVTSLYDSDDPKSIELNLRPAPTPAIIEVPKKRRRRESHVDPDTLLSWIKEQVREHADLEVTNLTASFRDGRVLCAIISHYRPDLLDYSAINAHDSARNNQVAFDLLEKELGVPPIMSGEEMANNDTLDFSTMLNYLTKVYDTFRCEIPHIKYPKWDVNLSIARTSTVVLPSFTFSLQPILITPRSSARLSDEATDHIVPLAAKQTSSHRANTQEENLILVPIKSIENYLSKTSFETMKFENLNDISTVQTNEIDLGELWSKLSMCRYSKSDPLFPSLRKIKSKRNIIRNKKLQIGQRSSTKSISSKSSIQLRNQRSRINKRSSIKIPIQHINDSISGSGDYVSDDRLSLNQQPPPRKPLEYKIKIKSSESNSSKNVLKLKFSSKIPQKDESNNAPNKSKLILEHANNKWFDDKVSNDTQSSMAGSTQLTLNFLKEMDTFLKKQTQASKELHSLRVKIKSSKPIPKDIPQVLLEPDVPKELTSHPDIVIKNVERKGDSKVAVQVVKFFSISNCLSIIPKFISNVSSNLNIFGGRDGNDKTVISQRKLPPVESLAKVEGWIKSSNFESESTIVSEYNEPLKPIENLKLSVDNDADTIVSSTTKEELQKTRSKANQTGKEDKVQYSSTVNSYESVESMTKLVETLKSNSMIKGVAKISSLSSPWQLYEGRAKSKSEPPDQFSTIIEAEESDMPEIKRHENLFKIHTNVDKADIFAATTTAPPPRPSSRHKRHVDTSFLNKSSSGLSQDRKARKRKTLEKVGASVDKDTRATAPTQTKRETDEDFAARIKDLEEKWREPVNVEKKPKDLLRAIGKIETSDWNIKEIEKKIIENKLGKSVNKDKEKVPKWSREQFLARQTKMEQKHLDRQNSAEVKFAEIDKNIKQLEQKLKEGTSRDLNQHKVASITEKLVGKTGETAATPQLPKPIQKSNSRTVIPINQGSEFCHFCAKRVYLVERLTAEGRIFHTGCFRCQYCHTSLRLGTYMFDREGLYGHRFYCAQHFGMPGEISRPEKKIPQVTDDGPPKKTVSNLLGLDLLDRVQTPERIEFSNLSTGHVSSDHDESPSPIDEDEWTDRNNINSVIDSDSSDDSSSSSDTDSDDEAYEEALEEPITKEGTLRWAERYKKRYSHKDDDSNSDDYSSSDHFSYYENSSGDDDSDTATEGEEEIRARELRKQEVRVEPPIDAGTDTEVKRLINNNYPYDPNQCTVDMPDILNNTLLKVSKSSDNLSSNNEQFNSAESEIEEDEAEKPLKPNVLTKSVTTSSITATPVIKRNFVLPPKDRRKSFGKEFVPVVEAEPLLVIKRTPSKINLPPEIGKPKVQVKTNLESAKKYFGATSAAKPPINKPKKSPLIKQASLPEKPPINKPKKSPLIKQASLPEKNTAPLNIPPKIPIKSEEERRKSLFNFEPEESDLQDIDNYIESLMKNEDQPPPKIPDRAEEKVSSSIEDLLKALEVETNVEENEMVEVKPEEKIEDLLSWIEELDHKAEETQITSSLRPDKYKNLESVLKKPEKAENKPEKAENVIHKLCKDNISLFENHLLGKTQKSLDLDRDDGLEGYQLSKSKTDVHCNKRSSVDLDAVKKVDIKKVLQKFENNDNKEPEFKQPKRSIVVPKNIVKRNSFANFTFNRSFEKDDRPSTALLTDRDYNFSENLRKFGQAKSSSQSPQRRQESPSFLRKFRGFKASSESPQRTSITNLLDNSHQSRTNRHSPQRKVVDSAENPCKFLRKFEQFNADLKKLSQAPDVVNDNTSKSPFLRKFDEKFVDGVGISSNRSVSIIDGAAIPPNLSRNEKLSKQDVNRDKINLDGINTATPETGLQMRNWSSNES
ncbi:LIM domain [Popillia japonica]|uniref:F-actin monooxygenase n=1 Tax=Popillia japonica TaxID=7064 RepID=A0AAW1MJ95_POPJA